MHTKTFLEPTRARGSLCTHMSEKVHDCTGGTNSERGRLRLVDVIEDSLAVVCTASLDTMRFTLALHYLFESIVPFLDDLDCQPTQKQMKDLRTRDSLRVALYHSSIYALQKSLREM
jgi:hypothetical protein